MEIKIKNIRIWDRVRKRLYKLHNYNYNTKTGREFWKYVGCSIWLEHTVAIDVFVINEEYGTLINWNNISPGDKQEFQKLTK